jgi:hypothetical protein
VGRTTIDLHAVQQSQGFTSLAEGTKAVIRSLDSIDAEVHNKLETQSQMMTLLHADTESSIKDQAKQNQDDHNRLCTQITDLSQKSCDQSAQVLDAQAITKMAVDLSIERNLTEHNKTREEMNRLEEEAERQVEVLTEEIRQLKIELENSVRTIVASMSTASKKETGRLKEISNAKFNLWVAKELILEKLKVSSPCHVQNCV